MEYRSVGMLGRRDTVRIGFVDHHLNNYHADKFLALLRGPLKDLGAEVTGAWESDPVGDDWCAKNLVPRLESAKEVAEQSDAIIILAPDNIDDHLKLCREVLPFGKPTAIDKALAFNLRDAKEIVKLAKRHNTPITSSSALAFAVELEDMLPEITKTPSEVWATGMGEWKNYGLHTLSMVLRIMGPGIKRLADTGTDSSRMVTLDYGNGRVGFVTVRWSDSMWEQFPWVLGVRLTHEKFLQTTIRDYDGFYANLMRHVVQFFKTGTGGFPGELAMELVAVLECADKSRALEGSWVKL